MERFISVAIDGPSGAGKSSVAKAVAEKFGFIYVDTGAIYRTVGLYAQQVGLDSKDTAGIIAALPNVKIDIGYDESGSQMMLLDGVNVSKEIRTPRSSIYASDVSAIPEVRDFLMDMQRNIAKTHSVVMDGRDIGTVVIPDADVKIFLTASAEMRAQRRLAELLAKGTDTDYESVLRDIRYRDRQDSGRETAPLHPAEDSVIVDSTGLSLEEVIGAISRVIEERTGI